MTSAKHPITSHEFKLILKADKFLDIESSVATFWAKAKKIAIEQGGAIKEADQNEIRERETWYLDTTDRALREVHKFVLRIREEKLKIKNGTTETADNKKYKITLKYRNPDRDVSANQNLDISKSVCQRVRKKNIDTKFEADILPTKRIFAKSTSVKEKALPDFATIADVAEYFPGLDVLNLPEETPITQVNTPKAYEVNYRVGKLDFRGTIKVSLTFWYCSSEKVGPPQVAEFSFDYDTEIEGEEQFNPKMVNTAERFFKALQQETCWVDLEGTTKTALAYNSLGSDCL